MRLRSLLLSSILSLVTLGAGAQAPVELTLAQSRQLAQQALLQGKPQVTLDIASALAQINPKDAHALLMISAAQAELKKPGPARKAAALAYRRSENPRQRLQAAQMAAENALAEDRPTLTQIWLRRAALHTDSDAETKSLAKAYGRVRAINPWSLHAGLSVRPSNNVNNGSNTALNVIDGISTVGVISPTSQALSGTIGTVDLTVGYRLHGDARSRTTLRARTQQRHVTLSNEAKQQAPTASGSDFGWTYAELGLEHLFAVGQTKGNHAKLSLSGGALWTDTGNDYTFTSLGAERVWSPNKTNRFTLGAGLSHFERDLSADNSQVYKLTGGYDRALSNGDVLGVDLSLQKTTSDNTNSRADVASLRLSYRFAKKWGPAQASASLTYTQSDYPDYAFLHWTPGRNDKAVNADLSLFFSDYDYAGFAPKVTLRTGRKDSNISLFETRELSFLVGIQSKF